ncbi:MAG: hypothetical protein ACFFCU_20540, partial [Promethearchaeota archaeon]
LENVQKRIKQIYSKLEGPFAQKAPPDIVEKEKDKLKELKGKRAQLKEQLEILA